MSATWPVRGISGELSRRNASWAEAESKLAFSEETTLSSEQGEASLYYLDKAVQGATIMPRPFWFVEPTGPAEGEAPYVQTDAAASSRAKEPWTGITLEGQIEREWFFATMLEVYSFRLGPVRLCALPVDGSRGALRILSPDEILRRGSRRFHRWLIEAERLWQERRKGSQSQDVPIHEYLDNHRNLTRQRFGGLRLIYGGKGTNVRAAVLRHEEALEALQPQVQGFVLDQNFYEIPVRSDTEAHYLAAILNTSVVNEAIKVVQTQGAWGGGRDIHRRPLEMVGIPEFDAAVAGHRELADISKEAHGELRDHPPRRSRDAQLAPVRELVERANELTIEVCQVSVVEL